MDTSFVKPKHLTSQTENVPITWPDRETVQNAQDQTINSVRALGRFQHGTGGYGQQFGFREGPVDVPVAALPNTLQLQHDAANGCLHTGWRGPCPRESRRRCLTAGTPAPNPRLKLQHVNDRSDAADDPAA